ncbi:MAG: hypothetical protein H7296_01335 [Bacteroidia bacterium]|nr:hypothetical protein [Bacteroidia bacterium]
MERPLKYQWLIDAHNLKDQCPLNPISSNLKAYRWASNKWEIADNLLPKLEFDKKWGFVPRKIDNSESFICSCCGLSMFSSLEAAKTTFSNIYERHRLLLGYTHVSEIDLKIEDGVMTAENDHKHFDFFEYEEADLISKAKIIDNL